VQHDAAEREAMRAHFAAPAEPRPWLPGDADSLREGLLRGWRAMRERRQ
jgi:hypothetical protein